MSQLPNAHYGKANDKPLDWRKHPDKSHDDDAELKDTPKSVQKMLGFDPKELFHKPIKQMKTK